MRPQRVVGVDDCTPLGIAGGYAVALQARGARS